MKVSVTPAQALRGEVDLPGDKSITHRALMIGAISEGTTEISNYSTSADAESTLLCLQALGVETKTSGRVLFIRGKGFSGLSRPPATLDAGNSGTTIRLLTGMLAAQDFESIISGDTSLRSRPMKRLIDPLTQMGARIEASSQYTPPLRIYPTSGLHAIDYSLPVPSAQVKSAIILAALYAEGRTRIEEPIPSRDHTERMLNLTVRTSDGIRTIEVDGRRPLRAKTYRVPADFSAAAYFIVAACLVPNSEVTLRGVGLNPTRIALLDLLKRMGADIEVLPEAGDDPEPRGDVVVRSSELRNVSIAQHDVVQLIDEIPVIAVAAAVSRGRFEVRGAGELRVKESDRISSVCKNLRALGVDVEEVEDGFALDGENQLISSGPLQSYGDHRIAMAMGVAGLVATKRIEILDAECVDISFRTYWDQLARLAQ